MTLTEFIQQIRQGKILVEAAASNPDPLVFGTIERPLTLDSPEGVRAEAFGHGVFDYSETEWKDALRQVQEEIER